MEMSYWTQNEISVSRKDMYPARNGLLPKESPKCFHQIYTWGPKMGWEWMNWEHGQPSRFHPSAAWKSNSAGLAPGTVCILRLFPGSTTRALKTALLQLIRTCREGSSRFIADISGSHLLFLAVGFGNFLCERCQDWEVLKDKMPSSY